MKTDDFITLSNEYMSVNLECESGSLHSVENHIDGKVYQVSDPGFVVATEQRSFSESDAEFTGITTEQHAVLCRFRTGKLTLCKRWSILTEVPVIELAIEITCSTPWNWVNVTVAQPRIDADGLTATLYNYQKNATVFSRTPTGGCFAGMEMPYALCEVKNDTRIVLGHSANLAVDAKETVTTETAYIGVYQCKPDDHARAGLPRHAESKAMLSFTKHKLGAPRHGFVAGILAWHSEMEHGAYETREQVEAEKRALNLITECAIDWLFDGHPWGGQFEQIGNMREWEKFRTEPLVRELLDHAAKLGIKTALWTTMNHTHPWYAIHGIADAKPFRPDRPDWIMHPGGILHHEKQPDGSIKDVRNVEVNCLANQPFFDWLVNLHLSAMTDGDYAGWCMDGHFIGLPFGGRFTDPATCPSADHDHLPGDANLACLRRLRELENAVRNHMPDVFITHARPVMDMGVWSCAQADSVFTLHEGISIDSEIGVSGQPHNVLIGDRIRLWARIRTDRHFLPHHIDSSLLFPHPPRLEHPNSTAWSSEGLDYILLSAVSSSPKLMLNIPTRTGIPVKDRRTIKRWLDWARKNEPYLMVRQDLPQWPAAGHVDGSAHIINGKGFVFLFNPNMKATTAELVLNQSHGLANKQQFRLTRVFPESEHGFSIDSTASERISLDTGPCSAILLRVETMSH